MSHPSLGSKQVQTTKAIFFLTIAAAICWVLGRLINVYSVAVVGAVYELIWLPVLGILFILPVVSLVFWSKEKFRLKSFNLYSIIIAVLVVLSMILFS